MNYINIDQLEDGVRVRVVDLDTKAEVLPPFEVKGLKSSDRKAVEKLVADKLNPPVIEEPEVILPTPAQIERAAYHQDLQKVRQYQEAARLGLDVLKAKDYTDALERLSTGFKPEYLGLF